MIQVVWFRRDLRVRDHLPLARAAAVEAPVLPLYIVEPSFLQSPTFGPAGWRFIRESLESLRAALAALGQPLVVRVGEALPVFQALSRQVSIGTIWTDAGAAGRQDEERRRAVRAWAGSAGIALEELPAEGVNVDLVDPGAWAAWREVTLQPPALPTPAALRPVDVVIGRIPDHQQLRLPRDRCGGEPGGEAAAQAALRRFLDERGSDYVTARSAPLLAADRCSRLGPHLAFGTLSGRTAALAARQRLRDLGRMDRDAREAQGGRWAASLRVFDGRLVWRDHFRQQFALRPDLETDCLAPAHERLRPDGGGGRSQGWLAAWEKGETGYPLVDAAMRCLLATGWLNERLRALLVSFAAHDLWLDWRAFAPHLARAFVDFEPAIFYGQLQLLSGTAGSRPVRIVDPTGEGRRLDSEGDFIRRWLPELSGLAAKWIHAPHLMPAGQQETAGCVIGRHYPRPLVDHREAAERARARLAAVNESGGLPALAQLPAARRPRRPVETHPDQMALFQEL